VADTVLRYAALDGGELVLDAYCGVGMLTAFLAEAAAEIVGVEVAPDAVADAAVNLEATDNVSLYLGTVEEVLPSLAVRPNAAVVDPPADGLSKEAVEAVVALAPRRLIYVSSDVATLARDGRQLHQAGYRPLEVQPIDMLPQTYHVHTVSLWQLEPSS
jgi:23S rRNA (uracil1939-C5)-methyltransferase